MADEFKHLSAGTSLTQGEYEAVGGHVLACQATGDIVYASSGSQLSRLGKGAANTVLAMGGSCVPAWTASPSVTDLTIGGGCITLSAATDIDLLDNTTSALSFDASGKTGIIDINTNNCSEGVTMSGTLGVTGVLTANAGVVVDNFTLDGTELDLSSGNFALDVAGDVEINADGGCVNFKDASLALAAIVNTSCVGELRIHEAANYIGLKPPALSADQTWTWPATKGSACEVLTCDGCGVLSWAAAGGQTINNATANELVTIGGTTTELCAESNLTFDGATLTTTHTSSGHALEVKSTGADSNAQSRITNDARSWEFRVKGDAGDMFTITDVTAGDLSGLEHRIKITTCGAVTKPGTPAFLAKNSANDCNVTGDGTIVTVDFNSEIFDQGADFACDVFTAPVTGRYAFNTIVEYQGNTTGHVRHDVFLVTSNRSYFTIQNGSRVGTTGQALSIIADMDAADTAYVRGNVYDGAAVIDIAACSYFSGMLLA